MRTGAQPLVVSDVGLAKACWRVDLPVPPLGAKMKDGIVVG